MRKETAELMGRWIGAEDQLSANLSCYMYSVFIGLSYMFNIPKQEAENG